MTILDQSADKDFRQLHRHLKLYGDRLSPELQKEAADTGRLVPAEAKPQYYADPRSPQQFPCHTKVATAISYIYYLENRDQVPAASRPRIEERFRKFAQHWQIPNLLRLLEEKHAQLHQAHPLPDSAYALVYVTEGGQKERHCRLSNPLEVKAAAGWFVSHLPELRQQLDFSDRQLVATKILEQAEKQGADIRDHRAVLESHAGRGLSPGSKIAAAIRTRVKAGHRVEPQVAASMEKLAESVAARPKMLLDLATRRDLAVTLDRFDRAYGLLNKYSSLIAPPEEVVFEITETELADVLEKSCELSTGAVYDTETLGQLRLSAVEGLFGPEFARGVARGLRVDGEKLASVASQLPPPEAQALEDLLKEAGIRPLAQQAGPKIGFTPSDLLELAKQAG